MPREEKIVIRTKAKPVKENVNELTDWFCQVFDLATRENQPEPELFKDIISKSITGDGVTSKELFTEFDIPRSTVIYHLNRFIATGLVIRKGRKYQLRAEDMESTIRELQSDMINEFNKLLSFAEKLDEEIEREASHGRGKEKRQRGKR